MINLEIILHSKTLLTTNTDEIVFIGEEGEYGILKDHSPVVLFSRTGYLKYNQSFIYFTDGILKFINNKAILLASLATISETKEDALLKYNELSDSIKKESEIELVDFSKLERDLLDNIKKGSPSKL